jgi:hypothetical protein
MCSLDSNNMDYPVPLTSTYSATSDRHRFNNVESQRGANESLQWVVHERKGQQKLSRWIACKRSRGGAGNGLASPQREPTCVAPSGGSRRLGGKRTATMAVERKNMIFIGDITKCLLLVFLHTRGKCPFAFPNCVLDWSQSCYARCLRLRPGRKCLRL